MKKIIIFTIFCVFVANLQAQLFKKLKDKANEKINEAAKKVTKKATDAPEKTVENAVEKVETKANEKIDNKQKKVDAKVATTVDKVDNVNLKKKDKKTTTTENTNPPATEENAPAVKEETKPAKKKEVKKTVAAILNDFPLKAKNFNSETPINVPNAWGHWKDAEGNRYDMHSDNVIYKVTPDGKTFLYFSNKDNRWPKTRPDDAMSQEPTMDNDGNFYFIRNERNCQGIYKLTKSGMIEHITGINETYDSNIKDGKGNDAKIADAKSLKYLSDGNLYFTELLNKEKTKIEDYLGEMIYPELGTAKIIRKLTPDGEVTTLKDKNKNIFIINNLTDFTLDKDANIVFTSNYIYKLVPDGEIIKLLGTPDPFNSYGEASGPNKQRWVMDDVSKAKVPYADKLIYNAKNELIIWSSVVRRFAKFDGKIVAAFSGTNDMSCFNKNMCGGVDVKENIDGNATTAQYKTVKSIVVEGDDIFIMTYDTYDLGYMDRALSIRKISKDGSVKTIMTTTTNKFFNK
jgi:hypothetical protein